MTCVELSVYHSLGLLEFLLQGSLGSLQLLDLIHQSVLWSITAQFYIRAVRSVLKPCLGQLHWVDLGTNSLLNSTNVVLQLRNFFFSLFEIKFEC